MHLSYTHQIFLKNCIICRYALCRGSVGVFARAKSHDSNIDNHIVPQ